MDKRNQQTSYLGKAASVLAEAVWPTRCIACDAPGKVLCDECWGKLSFIDYWNACPRCGAPYGRLLCTECNTYTLKGLGYQSTPFDRCVSAVHFDRRAAAIVRGRKDLDERRLDDVAAYCIACAVPTEWLARVSCVCGIPATAAAVRRRGFDHGHALAQAVAAYLHLPTLSPLTANPVRDQRGLGRNLRAGNMEHAFTVQGALDFSDVLLVDDVYTTGATLMAAAQTLRENGVEHVYCATFAHVYDSAPHS